MTKKVSAGRDALDKLVKGLDIAANAVGATIGPKGRNVYLQEVYGNKITNDGVTVASKVVLEDTEEDAGAWVIRNVTSEQNDKVGDGTTTVAVLTQALVHACLERPENPMEIRTSLNEAVKEVYTKLNEASTPITVDDVKRVALISAEDEQLATIVSEITTKLGVKAHITVDDSKTLETTYEIVDGYEAPNGYLSPHFADKSGKATLTDCPVLVTDRKISNIADITPIFTLFQKAGIGSCVIVCDDIDDSMLGILVINKLQGKFQSIVIKAHGDTLKDISGAVGGKMVSASSGITFQNLTLDQLGKAKKVVSDQHKTLFLGDGVSAKEYAGILEQSAETEPNQYIKKRIEERVAALRGGIAILKVAAPTDLEREYLKLKAEDAIKAVQAAMEEGVVTGGGWALWRIALDMKASTVGQHILKKALKAPARRIVENGGGDWAEATDTLFDLSIVDPTKVERLAVSNAVSAAGTLITTAALITDIQDGKAK